jgi:hypothetical protein
MAKKKADWIKDREVRKHVPKGRSLPKKFDAFIEAGPPLPIEWDDLDSFGLKREALKDVLPFMRVGTGGMVTFWFHQADPAVVYFGDEGELDVVALNFDEFLKAAVAGKSGVYDFDDPDNPFQMPGVKGRPKRAGLVALQKKFDAWWKENTALLEGDTSLENLRESVVALARQMIADGRSKVYTLRTGYWSMDFKIARTPRGLAIDYLDFGKYYRMPKRYGIVPLVQELLRHVKNKSKKEYELDVSDDGRVSIDRDRELVLMSEKRKAEFAEWEKQEQAKKLKKLSGRR